MSDLNVKRDPVLEAIYKKLMGFSQIPEEHQGRFIKLAAEAGAKALRESIARTEEFSAMVSSCCLSPVGWDKVDTTKMVDANGKTIFFVERQAACSKCGQPLGESALFLPSDYELIPTNEHITRDLA